MTGNRSLAQQHDVLLADLDGTLVLSGQIIDHAVESIRQARDAGARLMVVTNNAAASPASVAERLTGLGIGATADDVVSSPLAAAMMLANAHGPGEAVLVVGATALSDAVAAAGLTPVRSAEDRPVAVVQGHSPDTGWRDLAEASIALRAGADWVATNVDVTLPTDRGLLPGNGSMVQALVAATGLHPRVAGKPARPLLDAAVQRSGAQHPLVVGDRLETDIAAAVSAGIPSLLVLTGVSTSADLLAAPPEMRPDLVAADLRGLVDPSACTALDGNGSQAAGGSWRVTESADRLELRRSDGRDGGPLVAQTVPPPLTALAALTGSVWRTGITRVRAGDGDAAEALSALGLA